MVRLHALEGRTFQEVAEVDVQTFRALLEASSMHSATSWWYLGEAEGYCFFLEKRAAFEQRRIKVEASTIIYSRQRDLRYPSPEAAWINLKSADLSFEPADRDPG